MPTRGHTVALCCDLAAWCALALRVFQGAISSGGAIDAATSLLAIEAAFASSPRAVFLEVGAELLRALREACAVFPEMGGIRACVRAWHGVARRS